MYKYIFLCFMLTLPNLSHAELYKVINEYGEIIFTDTKPSIDAKEHIPGRISSVKNEAFNKNKVEAAKKAREDTEKKAEKEASDN